MGGDSGLVNTTLQGCVDACTAWAGKVAQAAREAGVDLAGTDPRGRVCLGVTYGFYNTFCTLVGVAVDFDGGGAIPHTATGWDAAGK